MRSAIPHSRNTPSWRDAQFKREAQGQFDLSLNVACQAPFRRNVFKNYIKALNRGLLGYDAL
jgi:hypothetical protein